MDTALFRQTIPRLSRTTVFGRYGLAVASSLLAWLLTIALPGLTAHAAFVFFFAAAFVSARYGGSGPGFLAIALTGGAAAYNFLLRGDWLGQLEGTEVASLGLYLAVTALTTSMLGKLKRTTDTLREKESQLTDFVENATIGLNWVGVDGRILWANRAELEMLGYAAEDYIGHNLTEFYTDPERGVELLARWARFETVDSSEIELRAGDGTIKTLAINSMLFGKEAGGVQIRCFSRDITGRKRAEAQMLRRAQEQAVVASLGQLALSENDLAALLLEAVQNTQQTLATDYCHLLESVPDGKPLLLRAGVGWEEGVVGQATVGAGVETEAGYTLRRSDPVLIEDLGRETRFKPSPLLQAHGVVGGACVAIRSQNRIFGVLGVFTRQSRRLTAHEVHFLQAVANVLAAAMERQTAETVLRDREYLLRRVLDTNPNLITLKDRQGTLLLANQAFAGVYGFPLERLVGMTQIELHRKLAMSTVEPRRWVKTDHDVITTRAPSSAEEPFTGRDGKVRWYRTNKLPFSLSEERQCVMMISEDITERKAAEEDLSRLNQELERRVAERTSQLEAANHELEAFSYSISHDLRAPLRAIDGFARMIMEDHGAGFDGEGRRLFEVICRNAQTMGQLIDDLLAFSKFSRKEIASDSIGMTQLAQGVIKELTSLEPERRSQFKVAELPGARGDRSMLQQVFVNLLSNALKFTRHRPEPVIEVGSVEGATQTVYYVRDNGVGFDMRYAHKLFTVFQRLHSSEEFEGTGVGLAITQRIINRHSGRVWAEGQSGEGACFYFALPKTGH